MKDPTYYTKTLPRFIETSNFLKTNSTNTQIIVKYVFEELKDSKMVENIYTKYIFLEYN